MGNFTAQVQAAGKDIGLYYGMLIYKATLDALNALEIYKEGAIATTRE